MPTMLRETLAETILECWMLDQNPERDCKEEVEKMSAMARNRYEVGGCMYVYT